MMSSSSPVFGSYHTLLPPTPAQSQLFSPRFLPNSPLSQVLSARGGQFLAKWGVRTPQNASGGLGSLGPASAKGDGTGLTLGLSHTPSGGMAPEFDFTFEALEAALAVSPMHGASCSTSTSTHPQQHQHHLTSSSSSSSSSSASSSSNCSGVTSTLNPPGAAPHPSRNISSRSSSSSSRSSSNGGGLALPPSPRGRAGDDASVPVF
mmetsp:Transcript_18095/g.51943  ORF Transcript_18095/g.51943 Transcript_18095/m.51943 type:complete len:206 (+) Transcript_18095:3-620(+)